MKKLAFLLAAALFAGTSIAQDLPQPSPAAKVEQRVGLTDITIEYSRPGVKGRTVFGDLVPYGKVWRFGANKATQFTSSTEISFGGKTLPAGTYAVFAIPQETGAWEIVFNSNTEQWGAGSYEADKNVVSVVVKAVENTFTETFTLTVTNVADNTGTLSMTWEKLRVDVVFDVNTEKIAEANIKAAIEKGEELEKVYYRAASYYFKSKNDEKKALSLIHKGINVKETHTLYFLRAQILHKQGHKKEAIEAAEKAHKLALAAESKGWADYIKENVEEWKK